MDEDLNGELVRELRDTLGTILRRDVGDDRTPLRDLGLDSLSAARFILEIQLAYGVELTMVELADCGGVADLAGRVGRNRGAGGGGPAADPAAAEQPFPLTPLQRAYLAGKHPELSDDPVGCHLYREFEVAGLDVDRLREAWRAVLRRHAMLRAGVEGNSQRIRPELPEWTTPVHETGDYERDVRSARERLSHRGFTAGEWPLYAIEVTRGPERSTVHLCLDALLTDGHGLDLLLEHWWRAYTEPGTPLPDPGLTARDCLVWLHEQSAGPAYERDRRYWADRLAGLPAAPRLGDPDPAAAVPAGRCRPRRSLGARLSAGEWSALRERAGRLGVSPTALVLAVFAEALDRQGADEPYSLVLTTNRRSRLPAAAEGVIAPFTSTSVLIVGDLAATGLDDAARAVHRRLWEDLDHAGVSGIEAVQAARRGPGPALPVVFTSLLDATRTAPGGGFADAVTFATSQTSGVAVDCQVEERGGELALRWDITDALLPAGGGDVLFATFVNLLAAAAVDDPAAETTWPLNELQQAYFVARVQGRHEWDGCQVYHSFTVDDLDVRRLAAAWTAMIHAYEALRSSVTPDGRLVVRATAPASWRVPVLDDPGAVRVEPLVSRAFPLGRWPQFDLRVTRGEGGSAVVHLTIDLTVCDGRSVHFLLRELFRLYADPAARPLPAASFAQYAAERPEPGTAAEHWREVAAALPPGPPLPMPGAAGGDPRRVRHAGAVPGWRGLRERGAAAGIGPDALLLAALTGALGEVFDAPFAVSLVRWTEPTRRFRPAERTALSWIAHAPERSPWERAAHYQKQLDADAAADAVSGLAALRRLVLRRRGDGTFAFPVVHTGLLDLAEQPLPAGVTAGPWLTCTPDVSLDCIAMDDGDGELKCFWDATAADFAPGVVDRVFEAYLRQLRELAAADAPPDEPDPRRQLIRWNDTARPFTADGPVHRRFEEQARRDPDAVAVRWRHGTMTYGELNRRANAVARQLRHDGVRPGAVVAVSVPRGPDLAVAVYGILKAGGAYLPVEPYLPAERVGAMLGDAAAVALLISGDGPAWSPPPGLTVRTLPDTDPVSDDGDPPPLAGPDDMAYVIYTSGSTGRPKGVVVTHRPLHNLFAWCRRRYGFGPGDLGLCVTSLGFDLSVFDLLGLLGDGAAVYVADETEQRDPQLLVDAMLREGVTFWNSAPTSLDQLAPLFPAPGTAGADALRLVFLSGDYTPLSLPDRVRAAFPRARLVSLGGATEATVWSNYFEVEEVDPGWRSIPYGHPIDNSRYYVLDERGEPCPPGEAGDLYIAGACLSQGYANRPDLTAERFPPDPFAGLFGAADDERMYRTGDRAERLPDGTIIFLGRLDNQVKIRGFRVELGEIEHRLRAHPGVADVVVTARPDHTGDRKLVAYVVPAARPAPGVPELRKHAAAALPDYMVPNFVAFVDTFPATANGKLDRAALPWPLPAEPGPGEASADGLRDDLVAIFAELVGAGAIDPDADLWDQGVTSFTMVQVSAALQSRHGRRVPVSALLAEPTITGLARSLAAPPPAAQPEPAASPGPGVDFFDQADRDRFKEREPGRRAPAPAENSLALPGEPAAAELYRERTSHRQFTGEAVELAELATLLGLLRPIPDGDRLRYRYPSAGDTYAVQVYVHARSVTGLEPGVYYYDPPEHTLRRIGDGAELSRSAHFFYNRPLFDAAAFELHLVGQRRGIEPLYGADSDRFLTLEAGYIGQLLMGEQASAGLGLCPIGAIAEDRLRPALRLDDDHRFLQAFFGGRPIAAVRATPAPAQPAPAAPAALDLAVVGLAGRYPGADDLAQLWAGLLAGRSAAGPMPGDRAGALGLTGSLSRITGGFLSDIDTFDSLRFRVSPLEAATLDPQARLVLETVWRCLEDAGHTPAGLAAQGRVGVFVAGMWPDHQVAAAERWRAGEPATTSGIAADLPNRVSHAFGFRGPSIAVNTSCSSSLTALHLAAQSLARGECVAAVVAGVNLITHPFHLALLRGLDLVAADGATGEAYDADTTGWLPGEGCGALLLRPAGPAAADGDPVRGIVEATWTGHAGRTSRFGAPDAAELAGSLAQALRSAGLTAADLDYVETAAAGAALADAAELEALGQVAAGRDRPLPIGTIKPNLGHLEAASGLSQLTKVLLQFEHGEIAPTRLARRRGPLADWDPAVLTVPERPTPWPRRDSGGPPRALVNALGATGSYGHVVLRAPGGGR
ncbi:non-ribosomal peptide synthetase [Paractinoplanes atraurantiacus]|uniref:Amino acid adenylation domain-containing protein n=1 Tax=Paractinoplanes atraurantiacus TaxID=1036182 RepID=A0A285GLF7_9ACTN|nr:non-ribosomal peptide synthetase [Actinoplanes atraurantiacus]SNY24402.1 amino acid adenylation domain-containing protein [Actinoplanes atraurantiacus]